MPYTAVVLPSFSKAKLIKNEPKIDAQNDSNFCCCPEQILLQFWSQNASKNVWVKCVSAWVIWVSALLWYMQARTLRQSKKI